MLTIKHLFAILLILLTASVANADYDSINTLPESDSSFMTNLQAYLLSEGADYNFRTFGNAVLEGGYGATAGSLSHTLTEINAFVDGHFVNNASVSHTYTATKRTFVYLRSNDEDTKTFGIPGEVVTYNGFFVFCEVPSATVCPASPTGVVPLLQVDTGAASIDTVTDLRKCRAPLEYYGTLSDAVTDIGSTMDATIIVSERSVVASGVTTSSNMMLNFIGNGQLAPDSGVTVTVYSPENIIASPRQQIKTGSGTLAFTQKLGEIYPGWFQENTAPGTTDMVSGIQEALTAASDNGTVIIHDVMGLGATGLSLTGASNVTIKAATNGSGFKILTAATQTTGGSSVPCQILLSGCTFITIDDLEIDGNSKQANIIGMDGCTDSVIENCNLHDTASATANGVYTENGDRNKYINNNINNTGRGLWIGNANSGDVENEAIISGNHVKSTQGTGIGGTWTNTTVEGNVVEGTGGSGIALGSASGATPENITITGNVCKDNTYHGIQSDTLNSVYTRNVTVSGNVIYENDMGGIYCVEAEEWTITGNVCRDNNNDASGNGRGIEIDAANRITVVGNTCFDSRSGASVTQSEGIYVSDNTSSVTDVSIIGNICYNNLTDGIQVTSGGTYSIDTVLIVGNSGISNAADGLNVSDTAAGDVDGIVISGNIFHDNGSQDIDLDDTITATVAESNIFSSSLDFRTPFTSGDTTPSVLYGNNFETANTGATTISMFDSGFRGQHIIVYFEDGNTTIDFTGTNLEGNVGADFSGVTNDWMDCVFDGTEWHCAVHDCTS